MIFDCPTPDEVAGYLRAEMIQDEAPVQPPILAGLDQLESDLSSAAPDHEMREDITRRLRAMLSKWIAVPNAPKPVDAAIEFQSATPDEVFDFLDKELRSL